MVEWILKAWKEAPVNIIPKNAVCLVWKLECKMIFFETTSKKVARVQRLQKMKV
jgi:hypothetical protein